MKHIICLLILFLTLSCEGQNQKFALYLSNFDSVDLPYFIDRRYSFSRFYQDGTYKEIPESYIKKYICKDSSKCHSEPSEYRYDYGIKFDIQSNLITVLVNKQKYEGNPDCDFDLSELILIVYSPQGKIISEQQVGKNNDCWLSSTKLTTHSIEVQQIKNLEFNKPEMSCEIETKLYQITQSGIINNIHTEPIKKGIVIWDEQIKDFRLK